jgi:hypothetical protein
MSSRPEIGLHFEIYQINHIRDADIFLYNGIKNADGKNSKKLEKVSLKV